MSTPVNNLDSPASPAKKKNSTWIVIVVVVVLLCCCCVGILGLLYAFGDSILEAIDPMLRNLGIY